MYEFLYWGNYEKTRFYPYKKIKKQPLIEAMLSYESPLMA